MDEEKCRRFINLSGIYIALWELSVACLQIKSWSECYQNFIHDRGFWLEPIPLLFTKLSSLFRFRIYVTHIHAVSTLLKARPCPYFREHRTFQFSNASTELFLPYKLRRLLFISNLMLTLLGVENIVFVISFGSRVLYALPTVFFKCD